MNLTHGFRHLAEKTGVAMVPNSFNKNNKYTVVNVSLKKDLPISAFVGVNGEWAACGLTSHLAARLQKRPNSECGVSLTPSRFSLKGTQQESTNAAGIKSINAMRSSARLVLKPLKTVLFVH